MSLFLTTASIPAIILDVILLAILCIYGIVGLSRGLIRSVLSLLGTFVSFLLALLFSKFLVQALNDAFEITSFFTDVYYGAFSKVAVLNIDVTSEGASAALRESNIPAFLASFVVSSFFEGAVPGTTLAMAISASLSSFTVTSLAVLIIFVLLRCLVALLEWISKNTIEKIIVIGWLNRILGFVFGLFRGMFCIYAVMLIFSFFQFDFFNTLVQESALGIFFYEHNILGVFIQQIIAADWLVASPTAAFVPFLTGKVAR